MAIISTLGLVAGGISSVQQMLSGISASRRAKQQLEEIELQDLASSAFKDFTPSLELERLQRQNIEVQRSRFADIAAGLGAAEAQGFLGATEDQLSESEQQLFARMEQRFDQAELFEAQDIQRRQQMLEARDMAAIQSLQQEFSSGQQMIASGLGGFANLAVSSGLALDYMDADPYEQARRQARIEARRQARNENR